MKALKCLVVLAALIVATQAVQAADDAPWFDMANCEFCVSMSSQPGLLEAMEWESREISAGLVSVVRVAPAHLETFRKACASMEVTEKKAMLGEAVNTCGMCTAMGAAMMAGAKMETVELSDGQIHIMTSDKPEVVAQLHVIVQRSNEEMKKMMENDPGHGHEGHSHDGHSHGG